MKKTSFFQALRLVAMIAAVAGIIYALEFMHGGFAVWFWVALLGVGFFGLLVSFRAARRRSVRQQSSGARRHRKSCRGATHE